MMSALISPTFSLMSDLQSCSPLRILSRASFTHPGQSESVCRGHPNGGLVFCEDFGMGLSDHWGMKEGFGLYLLMDWMASNIRPADRATTQSTYLILRLRFTPLIVIHL